METIILEDFSPPAYLLMFNIIYGDLKILECQDFPVEIKKISWSSSWK